MKGYIESKRKFYAGEYKDFFIEQIVARESGKESQYILLDYLSKYSIRDSKGAYKDMRPPISLLITLDNQSLLRALCLLALREAHLCLINRWPSNGLVNMRDLAVLLFRAKEERISPSLLNLIPDYLTNKLQDYQALSRLLGIELRTPALSIKDDLRELEIEGVETIISLAETSSRVGAVSLLGEYWSYSPRAIEELRGLVA